MRSSKHMLKIILVNFIVYFSKLFESYLFIFNLKIILSLIIIVSCEVYPCLNEFREFLILNIFDKDHFSIDESNNSFTLTTAGRFAASNKIGWSRDSAHWECFQTSVRIEFLKASSSLSLRILRKLTIKESFIKKYKRKSWRKDC